jgi:hypothetical protein
MRPAKLILAVVVALAMAGAAAVAASPSLTVSPGTVHQGGKVTFSGAGWPHKAKVTLRLGKPGTASNPIAAVTTDARGRFRYALPIKPAAPTGKYVIHACRKNCAIDVKRNMTIVP